MYMFPIFLITFQKEHYKDLIRESKTVEQRIHLKEQLHLINQSFITFYN